MVIDATDDNHLLLSVLTMVFKLVRFGFFEKTHLVPLCKALVRLLDGRNDLPTSANSQVHRARRAVVSNNRNAAGVMVFATVQRPHNPVPGAGALSRDVVSDRDRAASSSAPLRSRSRAATAASVHEMHAAPSMPPASTHRTMSTRSTAGAVHLRSSRHETSTRSSVVMDCKVMICNILMDVCRLRVHVHMAAALKEFATFATAFREASEPSDGGGSLFDRVGSHMKVASHKAGVSRATSARTYRRCVCECVSVWGDPHH